MAQAGLRGFGLFAGCECEISGCVVYYVVLCVTELLECGVVCVHHQYNHPLHPPSHKPIPGVVAYDFIILNLCSSIQHRFTKQGLSA